MRITPEIRQQVIDDYKTKRYSYAALGAKYGISSASVGRIVNPDYYEREKIKNKNRWSKYQTVQPKYTLTVKFSENEQDLIDKVKNESNKRQYIKDLIKKDIENDANQ